MKYLYEYRSEVLVQKLLKEIHRTVKGNWSLMEICGGQTHSIVKNGISEMLPANITMVHGPGCPVCVTPLSLIDKAVNISLQENTVLCSFGDMIRVPGSKYSLMDARANGGNLQIVYSPLDAVTMAKQNPGKQFVFFAVGFETTAPANALAVLQAAALGLTNFSLLVSHVLVPPAIKSILEDEFCSINGFLAAGHVCTIMGIEEYIPIADKYKIPIVVTGFEPVDILQGILYAVRQLENGSHIVENQYSRIVSDNGNKEARTVMQNVFEIADREWRGIGTIPASGYGVKSKYKLYDAEYRFSDCCVEQNVYTNIDCIAGEILRGLKKPKQCSSFGTLCTPENPVGAPMVSSEGACAAYFHYNRSFEPQPKI